jgi:hypothetical protein
MLIYPQTCHILGVVSTKKLPMYASTDASQWMYIVTMCQLQTCNGVRPLGYNIDLYIRTYIATYVGAG